ncbi:MAG: TSUP family transporter [Marinobacterium sp.]
MVTILALHVLLGAVAGVVAGLFGIDWGEPELPEWSLGYVYLPAFVGIVLASSLTALLGARLAHRLSRPVLKKIFAAFLVVVAMRFILSNLG